MKQDLAEKIAQQTAKKTAQAEQAAKKKIEKLEKSAAKKTAAAEKKEAKQAAAAAKRAAKAASKVANAEKKAAAQVAKANKKAAAQSEKAARLAAKKQAKGAPASEDGEAAGEGAQKKKGGKKILLLLPVVAIAVAAGVFFFLRGRGGEKEPEPLLPVEAPAEYLFGEEAKIPALPISSEEVLVYETEVPLAVPEAAEPEDTEAGSEDAENADEGEEAEAEEEEPATAIQYTYEGLQDPKGLLSAYAALLTAADVGFSPVDEELYRIDLPDFDGKAASEGQEAVSPATSVYLARNGGGESGLVHALRLSWDDESCTVVVEMPEGRVRDPQPAAGSMAGAAAPGLTVDGFKALSPSALGLPGTSMDEYNIYVQDGTIMVYGNTCIRLGVYAVDSNSGSNQIAGNYFLSADGQHLYRYDVVNNSVEELDIDE